MKGKGIKKRSKTYFKAGHAFITQKSIPDTIQKDERDSPSIFTERLLDKDFKNVVDISSSGTYQICRENGSEVPSRILRPHVAVPRDAETRESSNEYRLFHRKKLIDFVNSAFKQHTGCKGELIFADDLEEQRGLCWTEVLKCKKCKYTTAPTKLYNEVHSTQRGRRFAAPNLGLQVGLTHTPIGNRNMRTILASMGIPPPSRSTMQGAANRVNNVLVSVNETDMSKHRKKVLQINRIKDNEGLAVETDSCYNIKLQNGGLRVPGQPSSQVSEVLQILVTMTS